MLPIKLRHAVHVSQSSFAVRLSALGSWLSAIGYPPRAGRSLAVHAVAGPRSANAAAIADQPLDVFRRVRRDTVIRSRAAPRATVGNRIAGTRQPAFRKRSAKARAAASSPTIRGRIADVRARLSAGGSEVPSPPSVNPPDRPAHAEARPRAPTATPPAAAPPGSGRSRPPPSPPPPVRAPVPSKR